MNINTTNPRRSIWFSQHPPVNKADVWLSYNRHYSGQEDDPETENDESIEIDSLSQRKCDLVMKIWDCGEWKPILGYNSTAANKMNTVNGVEYSCTLPNNYGAYSVTGYTGFHMPLFRNDNSSPDELFDAGTVGNVLLKFVSENEWKTIIEDGGLGDAVEFNFPYAGSGSKGGIWADMFSNSDNPDTSTANKTYLAQAKYKYQPTQNDYNLFVHAKDLIEIINTYITENPSGDTIDIDILRATTTELGGIKASAFRSVIPQEELAEACFNDNLIDPTLNNDRLYVWAKDIMQAIESYTDGDDSEIPDMLYNWFQSSRSIKKDWNQTDPSDPGSVAASKPLFSIWGANNVLNAGKVLTVRSDAVQWEQQHSGEYTESDNILEWVAPSDLISYTLELATPSELGGILSSTHTNIASPRQAGIEVRFAPLNGNLYDITYGRQIPLRNLSITGKQVVDVINDYLNQTDSDEWDLNLKASYGIVVRKQEFVDDDNNTVISYTHSLSNYGQYTKEGMYCRTKFYNTSSQQQGNRDYSYNDGHGLEWISGSQIIKDTTNYINDPTKLYLSCVNGTFLWDLVSSGGGGGVIYEHLDRLHYQGAASGDYVIYVPSGGTGGSQYYLNGFGEWSIPNLVQLFSGATSSAPGASGLVPAPASGQQNYVLTGSANWRPVSDVFNINTDHSVIANHPGDFTLNDNNLSVTYNNVTENLGTLYPWNYYIISCNKSNTQFNFSISSARSNAGNPIYIRINTDALMTLSGLIDYINSNNVFVSNTTLAGDSSYLLTIQFEIIKIEKIASTKQSSANPEEQLSGNGGN